MSSVHSLPNARLAIELMRSLALQDEVSARSLLQSNSAEVELLCPDLARWRLAGYVYSLIDEAGLKALLTATAAQILEQNFRLNVDRSEACKKLLNEVNLKLSSEFIPFVTMKGLYLAQRFFGSTCKRYMWDLDILVHYEHLEKALGALSESGLRSSSGLTIDAGRSHWGIHAVEVRGEAGKVDIHHVIRSLPGVQLDVTDFWGNAREFDLEGNSYLTLSDEDTLLTALLGLGADIQSSHHRLRKIWDIYIMLQLLDKEMDWEAFFDARQQEGSLNLVVNMMSFCLNLVGTSTGMENLQVALTNRSGILLIKSRQMAEDIFLRRKQHPSNRLLFARMLPVSSLQYFMNWLISLPVRSWHFR